MLWIGVWALLGKVFSTRANVIAHSVTALPAPQPIFPRYVPPEAGKT
mgnify:CR=1 FL=1